MRPACRWPSPRPRPGFAAVCDRSRARGSIFEMRLILVPLALAACHNDYHYVTHAFIADAPCGQGPYDIHLRADGKMGSEGVEVIACTAHQLAGHVEVSLAGLPMGDVAFGDHPDNARCLAGGPIVATAPATRSATEATSSAGGPGARGATPALVEQPYTGHGGILADELCAPYHLPAQQLMIETVTTTDLLTPGSDIHVRIWSDVPDDLQGVVFLVRHAISTRTRAEERKEWADLSRAAPSRDKPARPAPPPDHGAPPSPLAEARPARPEPEAVWVPGYWTWTGAAWGWTAGFWRDDRVATPAPRVEIPGPPPAPTAMWVTGTWQLRAGAWVWIGGRWRR